MKHLKRFESFDMNKDVCDRCGSPTGGYTTMSQFNTDVICMDCKDEEKEHPDYKKALDAEHDEIKKGNFNFPGIGYTKP